MKTYKKLIAAPLVALTLFSISSCKDSGNDPEPTNPVGEGRFVVAAKPTGANQQATADYLFTTENLEEGLLSTKGDGVEQDGSYRYYITSGPKFYSLLYGQANPGAVTIYELDEYGELKKLTNFISENARAFTKADDDILFIQSSGSATSPISQWFRVGFEENRIVANGSFDAMKLAGNGEFAQFSWIKQVGNKIFMPYFCIHGTSDLGWTTAYPDSSWVAVFSYPSMELEKVIKDNRTSSIGLYYKDGLALTENGDVYGFSPANSVEKDGSGVKFNGTKPSAIVRIKSGTTEFDQDYFYNIEEASSGYYISGWDYAGNGLALAFMNKLTEKSQWSAYKRLAIVDLVNQKFTWVDGTPAEDQVSSISSYNYNDNSGNIFLGISTTDAKSFIYKINAATAAATKGLEMEGANITSVTWLPAN